MQIRHTTLLSTTIKPIEFAAKKQSVEVEFPLRDVLSVATGKAFHDGTVHPLIDIVDHLFSIKLGESLINEKFFYVLRPLAGKAVLHQHSQLQEIRPEDITSDNYLQIFRQQKEQLGNMLPLKKLTAGEVKKLLKDDPEASTLKQILQSLKR